MHRIESVAKMTGLTVHTLRYYEAAGILPPVGRDAAGHRRYSDGDLGWVRFVQMLKATGMSMADIRAFVAAERRAEGGRAEKLRLLTAHRAGVVAHMALMAESLENLDRKIVYYGGAV